MSIGLSEAFFLCFTVCPGQPSSISEDAEAVTLVGGGQDAVNLINQKDIQWGVRIEVKFASMV